MKRFFSFLAAAAMLFAASCAEDTVGTDNGNEAQVTFNLGLEGQSGTRANATYGTGVTVTDLHYAVFDGDGNRIPTIAKKCVSDEFNSTDNTANVKLTLAKDQWYTVVFWAQHKDAAYEVSDNMVVTVKYVDANGNPIAGNLENRDAFYGRKRFQVKGSETFDNILLTRPFAQLNVGVTAEDYKAAKDSGVEITKSKAVVKGLRNTLDLLTGVATGDVDVEYTFAMANTPKSADEELRVKLNGADKTFEYLSMNYILVGTAEEGDDAKANITASFEFQNADDSKKIAFNTGLDVVPVERNHRTNIIGQILTGNLDFEVKIDAGFVGHINPTSTPKNEAELRVSIASGVGEITLQDDITLTQPLVIPASTTRAAANTIVINLNGKTITGNQHKDIGAVIKNEGNAILKNGTVKSTGENGGSAVLNEGTLTVENVTLNGAPNANGGWPSYTVNNTGNLTINNSTITSYHGSVSSYGDGAIVTLNNSEIDMQGIPGFTSHGIYTYNNGKVIVNGGTYANKATDQNASGASVINGAVEVNAGSFSGRIENYYGTPVLKGGSYSVTPKFIAEGYKAVEKDGRYYVVAEQVDAVVETADELIAGLESGKGVLLENDVKINPAGMSNAYGTTGINVKNGQTIDGGGNTLDIKGAGGTWDSGISTTGGVIKNITVTGSFRGIFINHNSTHCEKVILENVVIDGTTYTISCDQGTNNGLEATNCTFNGWTSYAATLGNAKFVNCKFGEGNSYAYCRPYAPTEFVGCEFEEGFTLDPRAKVTFENCTLNGVAITAENVADLVTNTANATVK